MIVVIAALAMILGAPHLGKPPDPSIVEASPQPDWYLLWYFAMLALLPHGTEKYFMVFGPLLAGIILIALPFVFNRGERSPRRGRPTSTQNHCRHPLWARPMDQSSRGRNCFIAKVV
jgi:ubiquinol-cytochrome c reductase cytochrome b subunit